MKTKFVRFNKLPKIDPTQPAQSQLEIKDSKVNLKQINYLTTSAYRKSQTPKLGQLLDAFEALMKKSSKQGEYQLQARDRSVLIDLPQENEDYLDNQTLKQWLTDVCNKVFSSAFFSLSNQSMTYQQTKIFCSEGILKNILLMTKKYRLTEAQMELINQHIQERIVPYMQKKYPLTESSDVNKAIDERVKPIDNRQALQNDLLQKCDVVFTYRQQGNYNDLIMRFLNWLMTEIDQPIGADKKITVYQEFYQFVSNIFNNVSNQNWMNERTIKSLKNITEEEKNQMLKNQNKDAHESSQRQKYAAKVKEYTHYAIGRKISKNVPTYTEEEIQSGHLIIKHPAILRILTKWCEELWDKFKTKNYYVDRQENLRVQEKGGNVNTMFMWMKMPLNDLIQEEKIEIQSFMKELQKNNFDQQAKLLLRELQRDGFSHIEKYEKACGKFAYTTVNNLHSYIVLYLNRIIHGLLKVSKELYDTKLSTKARWTSPPDLLSFKIGDLMRCKCSSKQREILKIFEYLDQVSIKQPKMMKIIRVKNRLKLGTNDILINVIYKEKYLCEVQLAVKSVTSKFIQCSNLFSHYVYQLGRTLFGPITELCSVWTSIDPRAIQYLNLIKNEPRVTTAEPTGCKKLGLQHNYTELNRPFVCSDCNKAYSHTNYLWIHQKCANQDCGHMICGLCRIQNEDPDILKLKLLSGQSKQIQQACTSIVNRKAQSERTIPTYGVCIQFESKKIKVQRFKKLEIKRILTLYGLVVDNKTKKETVIKIDDLIKKDAEKRFLKKYLVFEIPQQYGKNLININEDRAKKQFIIPQKVKYIYKKEQQILSLINENLDDKSIEIMKGSKEGMDHVKNMELADNKLTNVKFITQNFPNVDRLQLSRNKISSIQSISKLKGMLKLNVRDNLLTSLPNQICDLTGLEGLNIRNNKITALPENFGNIKNLKKLQSDKNQIKELPESFKNLTKLTFLDLSKNKLTKFPAAIESFVKIKQLALSKNKLEEIPQWIGNLKQLISLDLSQTGLKNFPSSIFNLKNLQIFKIDSSYNSLSPEIQKLTKLKHLSLKMINIRSLPKQMSNLCNNLQTLELQGCKLHQLPDWLSDLKKLETFSLIDNDIAVLSNQITEMVFLKYLKIQGQQIVQLPRGIQCLAELRTISLDRNKFKEIPNVLKEFPKLYSLSIQGNQIQIIAENYFQSLQGLQTLQLDNNKIRKLPQSIENLRRLKKLTHEGNNLENPPEWISKIKLLIEHTLKLDDFNFKKTISGGGLFDSKIFK